MSLKLDKRKEVRVISDKIRNLFFLALILYFKNELVPADTRKPLNPREAHPQGYPEDRNLLRE
jgi:hypothetical protein